MSNHCFVRIISHFRTSIFTYLIIFCFFQGNHGLCQDLPYSFRNLTVEDGLSSNVISSIHQDQSGFIWIGTDYGLTRFDGIDFKTYHLEIGDTNTLPSHWIGRILETISGELIVFTNGGIRVYNPILDRFEKLTENASFVRREDLINLIDSTILIHQILTQDGTNPIISTSDLIFWERKDGTVWISSLDGIQIFDPTENRLIDLRSLNIQPDPGGIKGLYPIFEDPAGLIYLRSNSDSLYTIDWEKKSIEDFGISGGGNSGYLRGFPRDNYGRIWIPSNMGIYLLKSGNIVQNLRFDQLSLGSLSSNLVTAILMDNVERIWVGTANAGINIWDPHVVSFLNYQHNPLDQNSLSNNIVNSCYEDPNFNLWIAGGGSISFLNVETSTFSHYDIYQEPLGWFHYFKEDENGSMVIAHLSNPSEVLMYDAKVDRFVSFEAPIPIKLPEYTRTFPFTDSRGIQYYHSFQGGMVGRENYFEVGLIMYNPESGEINRFRSNLDDPDSLSGNYIYQILEYSWDSSIWITTHGGGLNRFDPETLSFDRFLSDPSDTSSLNHHSPSWLYEDKNGNLWILHGYKYGINMISADAIISDSISFRRFTQGTSGLPGDDVLEMLEDNSGRLWLRTGSGICKFDHEKQDFIPVSFPNQEDLRFGGKQFSKGRSGTFYFGTDQRGLIAFHPDSLKPNTYKPPVFLTELKINNELVSIKNQIQTGSLNSPLDSSILFQRAIELKHWQNDFAFQFAALNYTNSQQNKFKYKLEAYDDLWIETSANNANATYTNLSPGNYTFRVIAANNEGVWNMEGASLEISILPPWWQSRLAYIFYFFLSFFAFWRVHVYQKERTLKKARDEAKDKELAQAKEIEKAYTQLKETQTQLIHSEKMASLGELTAGIAHEIQNPLNFVNNFTEVSKELVAELKEERVKDETEREEQVENELIDDLDSNLEKVLHHGRRADSIVKNMLQHSRSNAGQKELTDLNALCNEYLNLSYHGMRAKNREFNATFKSEIEPDLPLINVVPQDISRVLLNLFNNAFQAVEGAEKPQVFVSTKRTSNHIEIIVADSGHGIPNDIIEKIFLPFFSTRPTGKGTGLGLSLAYDIVKAHGGDLSVESAVGQFTQFKIRLPINLSHRST